MFFGIFLITDYISINITKIISTICKDSEFNL